MSCQIATREQHGAKTEDSLAENALACGKWVSGIQITRAGSLRGFRVRLGVIVYSNHVHTLAPARDMDTSRWRIRSQLRIFHSANPGACLSSGYYCPRSLALWDKLKDIELPVSAKYSGGCNELTSTSRLRQHEDASGQ
jgi:hypothetical protein